MDSCGLFSIKYYFHGDVIIQSLGKKKHLKNTYAVKIVKEKHVE